MNESTLTHLRTLVESAVRPVRASTFRKQEMREELLAHLLAVFEEEAARLGDERAALERAAQRFGNPAELTGPLQESITAGGYIGWFRGQVWLRLAEGVMVNHNRLYTAILVVFGLYILSGIGLLAALLGTAPEARPRSHLPDWSLPILAVINGFNVVAVAVTLASRLARPALGKRLTKALNLLFLIAPPFGTALGIYGLWKVDRNLAGGTS